MSNKKIYYFAYGSNMNKEQMSERCPKAKPIEKAILKNASISFKGTRYGVLDIDSEKGSKVYGALYEVTRDCIKALDIYEGYPNLYIKVKVKVKTKNGYVQAFAYKKVKNLDIMPPSVEYYGICKKGFKDWNWDVKHLSQAFLTSINGFYKGI